MRRAGWAAATAVIGWYGFALLILHPLTDAPVVDSWLYGSAVRRFLRTGEMRFAGFTQAMPIAQVFYGVGWAHAFGGNSVSLEMSVVMLAILCGLMFHALAIKCGASRWQALAATGLLICNPCFTFLSFSFMTEIPFLTAMVAAHLCFARAEGPRELMWLWLAAALAVIGFLIRPFAAMAIAGCGGAMILYDTRLRGRNRWDRALWLQMMTPFAAALAVCVVLWIWLTVLSPKPWDLQRDENHFHYIFIVPLANYLRAGVLGPAALPGHGAVAARDSAAHDAAMAPRGDGRRRNFRGRAGSHVDGPSALPATPEYSCFGGWHNVLILRGGANRFSWDSDWQYAFLLLASFGAAGLIVAFTEIFRTLGRGTAAILIGGGSLLGGDDTAVVLQRSLLPGVGSRRGDRARNRSAAAAQAGDGGGICADAGDGPAVARRDVCVSARDGGDPRDAQRIGARGSSALIDRRRLRAQRRGFISVSEAWNRNDESSKAESR